MKKIVLLLICILTLSTAKVTYIAKASLLGEIGRITLSQEKHKNRYKIDVDIVATGIAKSMSGNLKEHHTSKGTISSGEYYAHSYTIEKRAKKNRYFKQYLFDYTHKRITKITKKWTKGKLKYTHTKILKYFSQNDLLTVYHNIMVFKAKGNVGQYTIKAAGAEQGDKKLLFRLFDEKKSHLLLRKNGMEAQGSVMELFMKRSFFSHGKGSLQFMMNRSGIAQKVILTNVKLLGDIVAYRVH